MKQEIKEIKKKLNDIEKELFLLRSKVEEWERASEKDDVLDPLSQSQTISSRSKWLDWEFLIAGNWMAKVGIGSVLLASAWFLDLAFTNHWITNSGKVGIGLCIGFILSGGGLYCFHKKYKILSPALLGAGFSVLYISIFSSYKFYHFFSIWEAFLCLVILSILLVFLSKISGREALYGFGLLGCIFVPVLLSTGENSYRFLFFYLALNLVLYGWVSHGQGWTWASILVLVLHWAIFDVWLFSKLSQHTFWIPLGFLVFLVGFFLVREHFWEKESNQKIHPLIPGFLVVGSLVLGGISSSYIMEKHFYWDLDFAYLSMALMVSFTGYMIPRNEYSFQRIPILIYSIFGLVLMSLLVGVSSSQIGIALVGFAFVFSYSMETISQKRSLEFQPILEYILWILVILRVVFVDGLKNTNFDNIFFWNERFPILSSLVMALGYFYFKNRNQKPLKNRTKFFASTSLGILIWAFFMEVYFFIEDPGIRNQGYSLVLGSFAGIFLGLGIQRRHPFLRKLGLILVGSVIAKFIIYDIWFLNLIVKIIAGFCLGLTLIFLGLYYEKIKSKLLGNENE